eukprot:CAMPEP_0176292356 /NCGR_PEP_ID=MMETSP0121_2-20121125/56039_1 /TAXON_ID=160619 /ORGANISM="Kryptoperidinium foliaceum, Strain CCMP 1326" /LENGTH=93 /DNA_ID=CAMNT_0017633261 /DNA_START=8 /DNA_END=289 /DNA_ORIENTATION=+
MPQTTPRSDKSTVSVPSVVKDMLDEMESSFTETGNHILGRLSEINKRMDHLDRSISELMTDAGLEMEQESSTTSASSHTTLPTSPSKPQAAVL